jgi:hypothetical protein
MVYNEGLLSQELCESIYNMIHVALFRPSRFGEAIWQVYQLAVS